MKRCLLGVLSLLMCTLLATSCGDDDQMSPISLVDGRGSTELNIWFPREQPTKVVLQGGDGTYAVTSVVCDKSEGIEAKIASGNELLLRALGICDAVVTISDKSNNQLQLSVHADYYSMKITISDLDVAIGGDLRESEKASITTDALATIPVKKGGGYKFIFKDAEGTRGDAIIYPEKYGEDAVMTTFEYKTIPNEGTGAGSESSTKGYIINIDGTLRTFVLVRYYKARAEMLAPIALCELLTNQFLPVFPQVEIVFSQQVVALPNL